MQYLGCWNRLEKLAEMFQNTFHREHILLKPEMYTNVHAKTEDKKVIAKN